MDTDRPAITVLAAGVAAAVSKAEESLGRPVAGNRHDVELALQVGHWLGPAVLQPQP